MQRSLSFVYACVSGAAYAYLMPIIRGEILPLADTAVETYPFDYLIGSPELKSECWTRLTGLIEIDYVTD